MPCDVAPDRATRPTTESSHAKHHLLSPRGARAPRGAGHIGDNDFAVALFRADGRLDAGFGDAGVQRTPVGPGTDRAVAAASLSDGSFLVAGSALTEAGSAFALARYRAP